MLFGAYPGWNVSLMASSIHSGTPSFPFALESAFPYLQRVGFSRYSIKDLAIMLVMDVPILSWPFSEADCRMVTIVSVSPRIISSSMAETASWVLPISRPVSKNLAMRLASGMEA